MMNRIETLPVTIYIKERPDKIRFWTEPGEKYLKLYSLISKLKVINYKKVVEEWR